MADYIAYADPDEEAHRLYYLEWRLYMAAWIMEEGDYLPYDKEELSSD